MKPLDNELMVDYMEDELSAEQKGLLNQMLEKNDDSRSTLRQMRKLKREMIGLPIDGLPIDPAYYDQLADRIMAKVGQTEVTTKTWMTYSNFEIVRYAAAVVLVVAGGWTSFMALSNQHSPREVMNSVAAQNEMRDLLIETSAEEPSVFADTIATQVDEEDLVMDASAQKMDNLSDNERETFLQALKE